MDTLVNEGFRKATSFDERVFEAARLFREGQNAQNFGRQAVLLEAFTTSDFPLLLGNAFEREAIQTQRDAEPETTTFTYETTVPDFRPKKLVDLFGNEIFEDVAEGEEFKGGTLDETEIEVKAGTTGKVFGLTRKLMLSRDFSDLANFPRVLGNAAVNTENQKIFSVFVNESGFRSDFFGTVDTKVLNADNLDAAINALSLQEDHRGDLVDTSNMILLVPPSLRTQAERIVNSVEVELTEGTKKYRVLNPFRGLVTVVVSRRMASIDKSANRGTSWALLPAKDSATPAVVKANLIGNETVDIRVKRDQGERVGGGAIPIEQGSFNDDTIWFRGRHDIGAAKGFTYAVYASNGTV